MNSFELNKVLGAILGTCLITLALNIGASAIFAPEKPAKPGYTIAVKAGEGGETSAAEQAQPLPVLMATASVEKGQATAKQCRRLPHLREGRSQPGRSQSVGHRRPCACVGGRLQLFGGHEGQGRQLDL